MRRGTHDPGGQLKGSSYATSTALILGQRERERARESKREQERARESKREQERGAVFAFILAGLSGLALTRKGSPSVYSGSIRRRRFEMSAVSAPR